MTKQHFMALDGLRGVAAVAVVIYHIVDIPNLRAPSGFLAVDFFFALSGFVIAYSYRDRLCSGLPFRTFLNSRIARLYPILFLGFALAAMRGGAMVAIHHQDAPTIAELLFGSTINFLLIPMPILATWMFLNVPAWSLLFEVIANLVYAKTVKLLSAKRIAISAIVFGALLFPVVLEGNLNSGWKLDDFHIGILRVGFSFAVGALTYELSDRIPTFKVPGWIVALALFVALTSPIKSPIYDGLFVYFISPAILIAGIRASSFPAARFLGEISYPLYAIHFSVLSIGSLVAKKIHIEPWIGMTIGVVAVCAAIPTITKVYDMPARRLIRNLLESRQAIPN